MALTKVRGSILSDEIYRREHNLSDVLDKAVARNNLSVYAKSETFSKNDFVDFVFMWAGFESEIPEGFQLCNGIGQTSRGTSVPDMCDLFVIGAGETYAVGATGGSITATTNTVGDHTHNVSINSTTLSIDQMPSHTHDVVNVISTTFSKQNWARNEYKFGQGTRVSNATGGSEAHTHTATESEAGSHNHTVNITPPYYALCYIIKL